MRSKLRISAVLVFILAALGGNCLAQDDYQKWLEQEQNKMQQFISTEDKQFSQFLEKNWKKFDLNSGIISDTKPKPAEPPVCPLPVDEQPAKTPSVKASSVKTPSVKAQPEKTPPAKEPSVKTHSSGTPPSESKPRIVKNDSQASPAGTETAAKPLPAGTGAAPKVQQGVTGAAPAPTTTDSELIKRVKAIRSITSFDKNSSKFALNFYGASLPFYYNEDMAMRAPKELNNETISRYWKEMSGKDNKDFLKELGYYRENNSLNDWAYCLLLDQAATRLFGSSHNDRHMFIWFMLNKSGYRSRIGYTDDRVYLLVPSDDKIFGLPFFTEEASKRRIYMIDFDNLEKAPASSLYTYEGDYPEASKFISLRFRQPIKLSEETAKKTLKFSYHGTEYSVNSVYNKSMVDFLKAYPYSELAIYFRSPVSSEQAAPMLNGLKEIIKGKPAPEAVNILLRFVQTAFGYKLDDDQFGREKPLFVEETLYYDCFDCEDRSVLFSYLVKSLLGLSVVGLDFPGHVAAAVAFSEDVPGDFVTYKNKKYMICDPTYINAYVGMSMPDFKYVVPQEIIETE